MRKKIISTLVLEGLKRVIWNKYQHKYRNLSFQERYTRATAELVRKSMKALSTEASETEQMARSFFRMLEHKLNLRERSEPPTEEEVRQAIEQLKDVGRFSLFATISILPGGAISLIGLELLAKRFGVKNFTLIPSSFKKKKQ